jgi:mono/diheme cytochrome c family protein
MIGDTRRLDKEGQFVNQLHFLSGMLFARADKPMEAEKEFKAAISKDGAYFLAMVNLAGLYGSRLNRPEEAERLYNKALLLNPTKEERMAVKSALKRQAGPGDTSAEPMLASLKEENFQQNKRSSTIDSGDTDGSSADISANGEPMILAEAGGAKQKQLNISKKWGVAKILGVSGYANDGWKSIEIQSELTVAEGTYLLNCSKCHGINGDGRGRLAGEFEVRPRNHTNAKYMSKRTDDQLFRTISNGGAVTGFDEAMPPHKTVIQEKEIRALVKYLRSLCDCEYEYEAKKSASIIEKIYSTVKG